jgi:hypothetical protein
MISCDVQWELFNRAYCWFGNSAKVSLVAPRGKHGSKQSRSISIPCKFHAFEDRTLSGSPIETLFSIQHVTHPHSESLSP